jgi:hypothetical protein
VELLLSLNANEAAIVQIALADRIKRMCKCSDSECESDLADANALYVRLGRLMDAEDGK